MNLERHIPAENRRDAVLSLARALMRFLPGKPLTVKAARRVKERTSPQNAALWGVAYPAIRADTGNDLDDIHIAMCGSYFGWVEYEVLGQRKRKPRRTTTTDENGKRDVLSTIHFSDFWDHVQRAAAEYGIDVPDPDPQWREQAKEDAA